MDKIIKPLYTGKDYLKMKKGIGSIARYGICAVCERKCTNRGRVIACKDFQYNNRLEGGEGADDEP